MYGLVGDCVVALVIVHLSDCDCVVCVCVSGCSCVHNLCLWLRLYSSLVVVSSVCVCACGCSCVCSQRLCMHL